MNATTLDGKEEAITDDLPDGIPVQHTTMEAEVVEPTVAVPEANDTNASETLPEDGEASNRDDSPIESIFSPASGAAGTVQPCLATPGTSVANVTATLPNNPEVSNQGNATPATPVSHPMVTSVVILTSVATQCK